MSFESLLGNKTAATPAADEGLGPNKFQLQMFGLNPAVGPRPAIGFDKPGLAQQIPPGAMPMPAPTAPNPTATNADPYSGLGFLSGFFRSLDALRVKNGMPALADNPQMMESFRNASIPQRTRPGFDNGQ